MRPILSLMRWLAVGGVALLAATVVALVWANVAPDAYGSFWHMTIGGHSLMSVVNNGLMTIFFLLIGLEIKRELAVGELSDRRAASLPLAAAIGGMALPALIYLAFTVGTPAANGWGIPMATDVAFALAVLTVLKNRVPQSIWAFLLGVAVIDDIGAIIVIAVAYSSGISWAWLMGAVLALVAMRVLIRVRVPVPMLLPALVLGVVAWACTAAAGVHATIAGVAIGLLMPARPLVRTEHDDNLPSLTTRLIHRLEPWSSFLVLPIFALANAGIVLRASVFEVPDATRAAVGVAVALVAGKAIGIPLGAYVALRTGVGRMPDGASWGHVIGVSMLGGIGFTVSLFITDLAFADPSLNNATKMGVLVGSLAAAGLGAFMLTRVRGAPEGARSLASHA